MSERDTLDLDAELRHLGAQVDAHSRPVGANRAVRTARRRRTVRLGGAVAAALVMIVGVVSWTLPQLPITVPVIGSPSLAPTEVRTESAPLTVERLQVASSGWVGSWQRGSPPVPTRLPCADQSPVEPEPAGITNEYRSGRTVGATHTVTAYSSVATAYDTYMLTQAWMDGCGMVRSDRRYYTFNHADPGPNAEFYVETSVYSWRDGGSEGSVVLGTSGHEVAVLSVAGVSDPPEPVAQRIAEAVAADLLT